jgi:GxxExxY protein
MKSGKLIHEPLTRSVIGAFFDVYRELGFGFLEHVYTASLSRELYNRGHEVRREVSVPIFFKGHQVARQRLDMVVDGKLVIEAKSTELLPPAAVRQLTSYLCGTNLEVGLLLHFGHQPRFVRVVRTKRASRDPQQPSPPNPLPPPPLPLQPPLVDAIRTGPSVGGGER